MPTASNVRSTVSREEFEAFEKNVVTGFQDLRNSLNSVAAKIDSVHADALSAKRTDWKAVFSGLSLVLGVILALGGLIAFSINDRVAVNKADIDSLQGFKDLTAGSRWSRADQDAYERRVEDQNRATMELISSSSKDVDETLQREMRILDDALQREMRTLLDAPKVRLDYLEREVNELKRRGEALHPPHPGG